MSFREASTLRYLAIFGILAVAGAGVGLYSCTRGSNTPSGNTLFRTSEELKPDANPGPKAVLRLLKTDIPVDVKIEVDSNEVTLQLLAKGELLEVEKYRSTVEKFELVQAVSESFDPPMTLLKFPLEDGAHYAWEGRLKMGVIGPDATAKVTVRKDNLNEKDYAGPALLSLVELSFDGGAPTKATRTLKFWFVEGKGVLKREFDKGSARLPVPAGESGP